MLNKYKAITYLPIIILIALALNQLVLANFLNLSPWLGGGYGMFSTTDAGSNRHLHIYLKSEGIKKELIYPPELRELALKTKSFPTNYSLARFAKKLLETEKDEYTKSIEVQVWKSHFKKHSLQPSSKILKFLEIHID